MRAPRYRFPDEVRTATRAMADRMTSEGEVARTPEALDAWLAEHPGFREPLERGGYGTRFGAPDLLPLLEAMVGRAGGPPPPASPAEPRPSRRGWLVGAAVLLGLLVIGAAIGLLG